MAKGFKDSLYRLSSLVRHGGRDCREDSELVLFSDHDRNLSEDHFSGEWPILFDTAAALIEKVFHG